MGFFIISSCLAVNFDFDHVTCETNVEKMLLRLQVVLTTVDLL